MTRRTLTERRETVQAAPVEGAGQGRFRVQLITPGWGSSGYYSADLLEKAAKDKRFPAGLHMSIDHPTESQERERPEGSIRDLAAVLTSDAEWDGKALVGEASVFGPYREVLAEMRDAIGISIRAAAEVTEGEAEGRHGVIISDIIEGYSADFITHAGRGGRIVEVLESARSHLAEAVSDKAWSEFSDSDYTDEQYARACILDRGEDAGSAKQRYSLPVKEPGGTLNRGACHAAASVLGGGRGGVSASSEQKTAAARKLVGLYRNQLDEDPPAGLLRAAGMQAEALTREAARAQLLESRNIAQWIESRLHMSLTNIADEMFGDGRLTREERISLSSAVGSALDAFTETLQDEAPGLYQRDLWADPQQLAGDIGEANVPVSPAGPTTTEEHDMPQIEESRLRELEEASGRVETLESERDTAQRERDDARRDLATERATATARTRARSRVTEANANLHSSVVDRIVESATREVPLTDAGQLDEQTFDTRVDEARTAEESYLNGLAEASGAGTVRGFGGSTTTSTVEEAEQVREASDKARASAFGRKPQTQEA